MMRLVVAARVWWRLAALRALLAVQLHGGKVQAGAAARATVFFSNKAAAPVPGH